MSGSQAYPNHDRPESDGGPVSRATSALPHERPGTDRVGLTGKTVAERRAIERRKEELRAAKRGDVGDSTPRRRCSQCKRRRPLTEFYFRRDKNCYQSPCHECRLENCRAYRKSAKGKAVEEQRRKTEQHKAYQKAWDRRRQAALTGQPRDARTKLMSTLRKARQRFAQQTDPKRRAKTAALVLNLTAEIDRIDRNS